MPLPDRVTFLSCPFSSVFLLFLLLKSPCEIQNVIILYKNYVMTTCHQLEQEYSIYDMKKEKEKTFKAHGS